jgi:hypothetical protein
MIFICKFTPMLLRLFIGSLFLANVIALSAQQGGRHTYSFLSLSPSARITGLGGSLISVMDDDASTASHNPSLLNPAMHQQMSFNHGFLIEGIQHGYASYAHYASSWKTTLHAGVQYIQYGEFNYADPFGNTDGTFKAAEYALTMGAGRQVNERIHLGLNTRFISSQLESYRSLGIATDLGATYVDTASLLSVGLVFRNIGTQLSTYTPGNREPLPYDVQVGITRKLRYLPFRFTTIYHHLHRWNLRFDNPNDVENPLFGNEPTEQSNVSIFFDNLFRHFIFSGELLLGQRENLRLRIGYNHHLRQELSVNQYRSLSGISFGAGIRISRFRLDYGRNNYHLAGGMNHLSISTNLKEFKS